MRTRERRVAFLRLQWHALATGEQMAKGLAKADASRVAMALIPSLKMFEKLDRMRQAAKKLRASA